MPISQSISQLKLPLQISPFSKPSSNILRISLHPIRLRSNTIQTLSKTLIKSLGTLALEESFNLLDGFSTRKSICHNLNDGAKHRKTRGKFLDDCIPVFFGPYPKCTDSLGVSTKSLHREVDVLFSNFRERYIERSFDQFWIR